MKKQTFLLLIAVMVSCFCWGQFTQHSISGYLEEVRPRLYEGIKLETIHSLPSSAWLIDLSNHLYVDTASGSFFIFTDTIPIKKNNKERIVIDSSSIVWYINDVVNLLGTTNIKYVTKDTVPALLLVCDTSGQMEVYRAVSIDTGANGEFLSTGHEYWDSVYEVNTSVIWIKGYQVRYLYSEYIDPIHFQYLDVDKNPLPKNIVVWMAK